jgi:hypothetical protein
MNFAQRYWLFPDVEFLDYVSLEMYVDLGSVPVCEVCS